MLSALLSSPNDVSPWLAVFGRCHLVLLHAPLGMLPALAVLEYGTALLRRPTPRGPVLALAWLCALGAAAAVASGLVYAGEDQADGELLGQHKVAGIVLGSLCLLQALLALRARRAPFRIVLLLALVAMVPTGHLGGSITHGRDFLFEPLHPKVRAPDPPNGTAGPATATPASSDGAASEFTRTIAPFLERTCTKCHNEDKKKGKLLLTTREGIEKGGENGAVLVPGKPDESEMLVRCLLPIDDEDHMPPEEKPQPTAAELAALRAWIAAGAAF
ncbi:MAG TPA: c-type cytochrome domain-containing protein [Planctomycetota bacterium]|nr:c-type cytochrome domain-containing protein [Planctomycetota bacterium]